MSNPFTSFLSQWLADRRLKEFVAYWDELEATVVGVYRQKMSVEAAEPIFERVWPWLRVHYEEWADLIRPFWLRTKAGGQPVTQDPFRLLLSLQHPQAIKGNWQAMQHLPAAREALNQFILSRARQE